MAIEMRHMNRIKEKVVIRLDNRQIGWLVGFGLVISGCVFTCGYVLGQSAQSTPTPDVSAAAVASQTPGMTPRDLGAGAVATKEVQGPEARRYTYEHVLTAPTPPVQIDDPALKVLAEARKAGGNLDLSGPRPADPAALSPKADEADTPAGVPIDVVTELEKEMVEEPAESSPPPVEVRGIARAAAPAKRAAPDGSATPDPATPEAADKPTGFTIQVKAFKRQKEAKQFMAVMRDAGYTPYILSAEVPGKGRFYRVRLGKFADMAAATAQQEAFEKAEGFKTIVTPL